MMITGFGDHLSHDRLERKTTNTATMTAIIAIVIDMVSIGVPMILGVPPVVPSGRAKAVSIPGVFDAT